MDHTKSIELLNAAISAEMQSIHQYMYFHIYFENNGFSFLSNLFDQIIMVEIKHLEILTHRITFLDGDIELKFDSKIQQNISSSEMLCLAKDMEEKMVKNYKEWAIIVDSENDVVTSKLFKELATQESEHHKEFNLQLYTLKCSELDILNKFDEANNTTQPIYNSSECSILEPEIV